MDSTLSRTIIGIENNSNLCYLNSVLQLLFTVEPLNKFILNYSLPDKPKSFHDLLLFSYKNLLKNIHDDEEKLIDEENIIESTQFKKILDKLYPLHDRQHDVHEIMLIILDFFHNSLKESRSGDYFTKVDNCLVSKVAMTKWEEYNRIEKYSIINKLFKGQQRNRITCNNCYTENNIFDSFNCVTLQIEENTNCVQECFESFMKLEKIDYSCERCGVKSEAEKENFFVLLPQFLLVHINRFEQMDCVIEKNKKIIGFSDLEIENSVYKLKGFIEHYGNSINSGHYTTTIVHHDKFIKIDDENIYENAEPEGDIYLLLYELSN